MSAPEQSQKDDPHKAAGSVNAQNGDNAASTPADKGKKPQKPAEETKPTDEPKLSGKELKAKKQAEKQARRAAEKAQSGASNAAGSSAASGAATGPSTDGGKQGPGAGNAKPKQGQPQQRGPQAGAAQHRRTASQVPGPQTMPSRPKAAQSTGTKEPRKASKEVGLFGHLYNQPRRHTMEGVSKDIHPAVLALGFQMSNYIICGSNARCVAMLLAFKKVRSILLESCDSS